MASALSSTYPADEVSSKNLETLNSPDDSHFEAQGLFPSSEYIEEEIIEDALKQADMEQIDLRLRQTSLEGSIHESQLINPDIDANIDKISKGGLENGDDDDDSEEFEDAYDQIQQSPAKESVLSESLEQTSIYTDEWRKKKKHFFILSEAGKPIYARHGDENELASLMAVIQAHVEFVHDLGDSIRAIHCGDTTIAFLNKRPITLVAVSKGTDSVPQLVVQMTYMYHQLLSVITLSYLNRVFADKKGYDLRQLIAGSERLLDSLCDAMDCDPSFMLSSVRVLQMPTSSREIISNTISQSISKVKDVMFAILMAENRLITLVRVKSHFIHPADLHLILNLVNSSESFKQAESWTPICLPKLDSSGFMHAHVSYLSDDCPACLFILTVDKGSFYSLSEAKNKIVASLVKTNSLNVIKESLSNSEYTTSKIGVPDIRHFLYKSKTSSQFTSSAYTFPYTFGSSKDRLFKLYLYMQSKLHSNSRPLKFVYYSGHKENVLAWATQSFELYASFDPLVSKSKSMNAINKLIKWCKKEENSLFILSAPTF